MDRRVLLGIDLGTTVLKAAAFDAGSGRALAGESVRLAARTEPDGTREQDPEAVVRAIARSAGAIRCRVGRAWGRLAGVGLAAQGGSAIIADRSSGRALTPMQLWNDTRPLGLLAEIAAGKPAGYWRRLSWLDGPGAGLARMVWLRRRNPDLFAERNIYVGAGEFVFHRLTGVWRQDAGNALQIGCYDARRRRLVAGPLDLIGVPADFVAPMRRDHETAALSAEGARLLGAAAGVPVAGPYIDHEAGYLSAVGAFGKGGAGSRPLQCSLGTAWVGNYVQDGPPPPGGLNLVLPSPVASAGLNEPGGIRSVGSGRAQSRTGHDEARPSGKPGHDEAWPSNVRSESLVLRVMAAGTATWDWAVARFAGSPGARAFDRAAAIFQRELLPPPGLVALPWLTRPSMFADGATGSGAIIGINAHTGPADMLRAVAAGMCFELAGLLDPVVRDGLVDGVVLAGGAGRAECFRTLLAVLFDPLPVRGLADDESPGPRGVLHAFETRASRCPTQPVARPPGPLGDRIRQRCEEYLAVRRRLSQGLGDGGGLLGSSAK